MNKDFQEGEEQEQEMQAENMQEIMTHSLFINWSMFSMFSFLWSVCFIFHYLQMFDPSQRGERTGLFFVY